MSDVLNLGAGNRLIEGAVNHDVVKHRPEIDVVHDLNDLPWPWPDESFDHIEAWSVLEHLRQTLYVSLDECWRLLRPGGLLRIKLPLWDKDISWVDPSHYWKFSLRSLDHFDPDTERGGLYEFYPCRKWRFVEAAAYIEGTGSFAAALTPRGKVMKGTIIDATATS